MPCYLVRMIDNQEAVGVFVADDFDELIYVVDEVTDPSLCEYAEINNGGIMWPKGGARAVPVTGVDWEADVPPILELIGKTELTERWAIALIDDELEFLPIALCEPIANDR